MGRRKITAEGIFYHFVVFGFTKDYAHAGIFIWFSGGV